MSIIALDKVTVYGLQEDKDTVLNDLQTLGCLHLVPLTPEQPLRGEHGPTPQAREALKFLLSCPQRFRQMRDAAKFDAVTVEHRALELQGNIKDLEDERDFLTRRIADLKPWGEFIFPPLDERHNLRFWFFIVPHQLMKEVEAANLVWAKVGRDDRFAYVAVISVEEPEGMPVERTHTGDKPISVLQTRLEEVEIDLEDLQAERISLTRWCMLLAQSVDRLEDEEARARAATQTYDGDPLFALQAWAPKESVAELQRYADEKRIALNVEAVGPEDEPPTLLRNPPDLAGGQDLMTFYMTPNYRLWDPSQIVLISFVLFFSMIISDGGYGVVLGLIMVYFWKRMGESDGGQRMRVVFAALVGGTIVWGIGVGSYFGLNPPDDTLLGKLHVIDLNNFSLMMNACIFLGAAHLVIANVVLAVQRGLVAGLSSLGWAAMLIGGVILWQGVLVEGAVLQTVGGSVTGLGALGVVLFTAPGGSILSRLAGGLLGLVRITNAFGDVLSYLRLFALGLASASLALTFNTLAGQVAEGLPGIGVLFAFFIILFGHAINLGLAIMSGFVHGLRLNFIEFFNWGLPDEGRPFKAFARKEQV